MSDKWPNETRIDIIASNGNDGLHYRNGVDTMEKPLHYLDVKKQMLDKPQDWEVVEWLNEHSPRLNWFAAEGRLELDELAVFNKYLWNAAQEMMFISGWRPK